MTSGSTTAVHPLASALAALARAVSGVRPAWLEPLGEPRRPRVYFANHTSHLDAVVVWASLPPSARAVARPVAAADYWTKGPVRRYLATRVFRAILIDRRSVRETGTFLISADRVNRGPAEIRNVPVFSDRERALAAMVDALNARDSLILFPEGTRGRGDDVGEFRGGLYHLASLRPDVDLVPVHLENLNRVLPKGEWLPVPLLCRAVFGRPIRLEPGEPKPEFLARARAALGRSTEARP